MSTESASFMADSRCYTIAEFGGGLGLMIASKSWPNISTHLRGAIKPGMTAIEVKYVALQAPKALCSGGREAILICENMTDKRLERAEHMRKRKLKLHEELWHHSEDISENTTQPANKGLYWASSRR
jgi:hypothetical protein